jgi:hypothetical protein
MIMKASSNDDGNSGRWPDGSSSDDYQETDAILYRYVPLDPAWRQARIDQSHDSVRAPHLLRARTQVNEEQSFVDSTLYLG